jgi:hypothetical protein
VGTQADAISKGPRNAQRLGQVTLRGHQRAVGLAQGGADPYLASKVITVDGGIYPDEVALP